MSTNFATFADQLSSTMSQTGNPDPNMRTQAEAAINQVIFNLNLMIFRWKDLRNSSLASQAWLLTHM